MLYKIFHLEERLSPKTKPIKLSFKFTYDSVLKNTFIYKEDEYYLYEIIGEQFIVYETNINDELINKYKNNNNDNIYPKNYKVSSDVFRAVYDSNRHPKETLNYATRTKPTMKEDFTYNNNGLNLIVCESGICVSTNLKKRFDNILILYILGLAYNFKAISIINKTTAICDNTKELIAIRDEILKYDIKYYFKNPVLANRPELYNIYKLIDSYYNINNLYKEVKSQAISIAKLLEDRQINKTNQINSTLAILLAAITLIVTILSIKIN